MPATPVRLIGVRSSFASLTAMVALQCILIACSRPPSAARPEAAIPSVAQAGSDQTGVPSGEARLGAPPPVTMKPVAKRTQPATMTVAASLAGIDRHLVYRPFDTVSARDEVLGSLFDGSTDSSLASTLEATAAALTLGTLPYERFDAGTAIVTRALYQQRLKADVPIVAVRFAGRQSVPGGSVAVRFRVLAEAPGHYAQGLLLARRADGGAWKIEHLELDLDSLSVERTLQGPWDPYSAFQQ